MNKASKNNPDTVGVPGKGMPGYLPHYVSRLMNALNLKLLAVLRPMDLTTQQFRVMQVLRSRGEPCSIGTIWRDAVIEQSVVSRIVDQLEKRGFVLRQKRASNARVVEVTLTPVGRAVYESVMPHANAIVRDATSVLSPSENEVLHQLLARVFAQVSEASDEGEESTAAGS
jgi:DNA-binding MarR family transcriptional regulator